MSSATCETCVFWHPDQAPSKDKRGGPWGECRRNAPRLRMPRMSEETEAVWPPTSQTDWCGEFRPQALSLPLEA